jgi:hypothetical protein
MAGNTMTLDFAGDADKLKQAAKEAKAALADVETASEDTGTSMRDQSQSASRLEDRLGSLGSATTGTVDALDSLSGGLQAVADLSDYSRERAQRLARANVDVMQAQEDFNQALRDGKQAQLDSGQAALDLTQARLDEETALKAYNDAVKEHGKNSVEARQASIDLSQATLDVAQAQEDQKQATRDAAQANIDAKTAQVDLNDAMHEANPPQLQDWSEKLGLITPLLTAVVGVTSLVTAAQWAWNAATLASPVTWIVLGIVALIAIIALLVWKWDWVKEKGAAAWRGIRDAGQKAWDWLKKVPGWIGEAFTKVGGAISRPFIGAFNSVSDAWNNTVGSLSWTVPGWVPGIGGNSIDVPNLPRYHTGGTVPGPPGTEVPIMAMAGEQVSLPGRRGTDGPIRVTVYLDSGVIVDGVAREVSRRGGRGPNSVQLVLGKAA